MGRVPAPGGTGMGAGQAGDVAHFKAQPRRARAGVGEWVGEPEEVQLPSGPWNP